MHAFIQAIIYFLTFTKYIKFAFAFTCAALHRTYRAPLCTHLWLLWKRRSKKNTNYIWRASTYMRACRVLECKTDGKEGSNIIGIYRYTRRQASKQAGIDTNNNNKTRKKNVEKFFILNCFGYFWKCFLVAELCLLAPFKKKERRNEFVCAYVCVCVCWIGFFYFFFSFFLFSEEILERRVACFGFYWKKEKKRLWQEKRRKYKWVVLVVVMYVSAWRQAGGVRL